MLHDIVKKGSVDRSVTLRIIDSTDGTPETAVVYNTAGIDLWYRREGAAVVSITEATLAALTTAHTDGGFLTISHGYYRLDLPDAAFATGANHVDFGGTVTGMVVIGGRVRLVDYDPEDAVRMGLTALPASGTLVVETGDSFARLGAPAGASVSADVAAVKVDTAAILVDTGTTLDGRIPAALVGGKMDTSVGAVAVGVDLSATMKASVNTEVLDVLNVDTFAEPGQGAPAATTTLAAKINYLYKFLRNKITQTSTTLSIFADDGTTVDQKSTVSDDATIYTRGEIGTGP